MSEYAWIKLESGRERYCRVNREPPPKRGNHPAPRIASDNTEVVSQVDGRTYTSKAALRQSYRDKGYVEVGNEDATKHTKAPPRDTSGIKEAVGKAMSRVGVSVG